MKLRLVFFSALVLVFSSCFLVKRELRHQEEAMYSAQLARIMFVSETGKHAGFEPLHPVASKPNLVLVHGYTGSGVAQYAGNVAALSDYNLYLPDLLYHGGSTGTGDYSIEAQADHLYEWLSQTNLKGKCIVVASSYGGVVSARFVEKHPNMVSAFVIYDSPVGSYSSSYADSLAVSLGSKNAVDLLSPYDAASVKRQARAGVYEQHYIPNFIANEIAKQHFVPGMAERKKLIEYMVTHEDSLNAHRFNFQVPVYLIWGANDVLIPMKTCKGIQKTYGIPDSRLTVFDKTGHVLNLEHPKAFTDWIIKTFPPKPLTAP
jgi:pimeloyl-ACP methyl ester carboxylesterase